MSSRLRDEWPAEMETAPQLRSRSCFMNMVVSYQK